MSQLFYGEKTGEGKIVLQEEEARHCAQVLRHKPGDRVWATAGDGRLWEGQIEELSKNRVVLRLETLLDDQGSRPRIWVAMAPAKNPARTEWLLEKATELGMSRFTPLITEHSEKTRTRTDRFRRLCLAAAKQSLKAQVPHIDEAVSFRDWLAAGEWQRTPARYIGYCGNAEKTGLLEDYKPGQNVMVLIGPEGDFSAAEVEAATSQGFRVMDLGKDRLRTETAAFHAISIIYEINRQAAAQ